MIGITEIRAKPLDGEPYGVLATTNAQLPTEPRSDRAADEYRPHIRKHGRTARPDQVRLVNDRVPRSDANCALCRKKIEQGYVRELQTGLVYCNPQCLPGHEKTALLAIEDRARKVS